MQTTKTIALTVLRGTIITEVLTMQAIPIDQEITQQPPAAITTTGLHLLQQAITIDLLLVTPPALAEQV